MPFLDHDGKLAYTVGWYTETQRPVRTRIIAISKARAADWPHLTDPSVTDKQINWTGNDGLVHLLNRGPVVVRTGDWERITEEKPVKKPRRGKRQGQAYDWEWKWGKWERVWL